MQAIVTNYAFEVFSLDDWEPGDKEEFRAACRQHQATGLWPGYFLDAYTSNMDDKLSELVVIDDDGKVIYNGEL